MRLTRAAPARPTSSCTCPMFRRSAPFTAASSGSATFVRRDTVFRRGGAFRACFREDFFLVIDDSLSFALAKPKRVVVPASEGWCSARFAVKRQMSGLKSDAAPERLRIVDPTVDDGPADRPDVVDPLQR